MYIISKRWTLYWLSIICFDHSIVQQDVCCRFCWRFTQTVILIVVFCAIWLFIFLSPSIHSTHSGQYSAGSLNGMAPYQMTFALHKIWTTRNWTRLLSFLYFHFPFFYAVCLPHFLHVVCIFIEVHIPCSRAITYHLGANVSNFDARSFANFHHSHIYMEEYFPRTFIPNIIYFHSGMTALEKSNATKNCGNASRISEAIKM